MDVGTWDKFQGNMHKRDVYLARRTEFSKSKFWYKQSSKIKSKFGNTRVNFDEINTD